MELADALPCQQELTGHGLLFALMMEALSTFETL
jgi:hypothetical protein